MQRVYSVKPLVILCEAGAVLAVFVRVYVCVSVYM